MWIYYQKKVWMYEEMISSVERVASDRNEKDSGQIIALHSVPRSSAEPEVADDIEGVLGKESL